MLFIINPISGNGKKKRIIRLLEEYGYNVAFTQYPGHAEQIAREATQKKIIAVGGDGTVNEVARGILGNSEKALGIIPCGSGDGLALHLGLSRNIKTALKTVINGKRTPLDIATINGKPFLSVCGVGFDAMVSEQFAKSGKRGMFNYILQGAKLWRNFEAENYIISIDGKQWEQEATLITVGNSDQWGNRAKITPLAQCGDGILDITVADPFKTSSIPLLAWRLMRGNLNKSSKIHCYRGKEITITRCCEGPAHADGDWFTAERSIEIKIIPGAIDVLIP